MENKSKQRQICAYYLMGVLKKFKICNIILRLLITISNKYTKTAGYCMLNYVNQNKINLCILALWENFKMYPITIILQPDEVRFLGPYFDRSLTRKVHKTELKDKTEQHILAHWQKVATKNCT